jgi:hypothetical protein
MNFHFDLNVYVILSFVVAVIAITRFFRWKREQLWHETARLALEKGQPIPQSDRLARPGCDPSQRHWRDRSSPWFDLRRGLVLMAIGAALYLALPGNSRMYAAIPGFIGVVTVIFALLTMKVPDKGPDSPPRQPSDRV